MTNEKATKAGQLWCIMNMQVQKSGVDTKYSSCVKVCGPKIPG